MKVIFLHDVPRVARRGEIKDVAEAYARNFLLPRGHAAVATRAHVDEAREKEAHDQAEGARRHAAMDAARQRLAGISVRFTAPANDKGTLFAAIKSPDIIADIKRQYGLSLAGVTFEPDHIKSAGEHRLIVHWPGGATSSLHLVISHA